MSRVPILYNPYVGYKNVTSNVTISSSTTISADPFGIGSNIYLNTMTFSGASIDVYGASNITESTTIESLVSISLNNTGQNSNTYTFSNIEAVEQYYLSYDTITHVYGYSNTIHKYYEAYNPTNTLYTSNSSIPSSLTSNTSYELTMGTTSYNYNYNHITTSVYNIYESVIQLNSNLLYCRDATYIDQLGTQSIIIQGDGIVNQFMQSHVNARQVYIKNTALPSLLLTVTIPIPTSESSIVNLDVPVINVAAALNSLNKGLPFAPARVHVLDMSDGYMWGDLAIPMNQIQSKTMTVWGNKSTASIRFFYSSSNYEYVSTPITHTFNLNRSPFVRRQYFNTGVSLDTNRLSPYVFHWNNTYDLSVIEKSQHIQLSLNTFSVQDIIDGHVVATFTSNAYGYIRFQNNTQIDMIPYVYNHYQHPSKVFDSTTLYIQDIGSNVRYTVEHFE